MPLHAGGCISARVPPPHFFPIGAVMQAFNFAELKRVDDETNVAIPREPFGVMLIECFRAIADAVLLNIAVAADVENRGGWFFEIFGNIEIGGDIKLGAGLEVKF